MVPVEVRASRRVIPARPMTQGQTDSGDRVVQADGISTRRRWGDSWRGFAPRSVVPAAHQGSWIERENNESDEAFIDGKKLVI
jgi:hypothetical protein